MQPSTGSYRAFADRRQWRDRQLYFEAEESSVSKQHMLIYLFLVSPPNSSTSLIVYFYFVIVIHFLLSTCTTKSPAHHSSLSHSLIYLISKINIFVSLAFSEFVSFYFNLFIFFFVNFIKFVPKTPHLREITHFGLAKHNSYKTGVWLKKNAKTLSEGMINALLLKIISCHGFRGSNF